MDEPQVEVSAVFEIAGRVFTDVNPLARVERKSGATIPGVRSVNADQRIMHAEFSAMYQAYEQNIRGGSGVLRVQGLPVCPYCKGDLKTLARAMGLDQLTVYDANGDVIEFATPTELLPVKSGGKRWR